MAEVNGAKSYNTGGNLFDEWLTWGLVTLITSALPFFIAFVKYLLVASTTNYLDYIVFSDILALLVSVSMNCLMIFLDRNRNIHIWFRRVAVLLVGAVCLISFIAYGFVNSITNYIPNEWIPRIVILLSLLNTILGCVAIYKDEKNS